MNPFRPLVLALVFFAFGTISSFAQGSAFTYQGRLLAGTNAVSGQYEMSFTLFDAATNGNVVGPGQTVAPVNVSNGLFTVTLDFGAGAFTGPARWLEISVTLFGSDMIPTVLRPRQPVTPAPYALHAANAAGLMSFTEGPMDIKLNGERALRLEPTFFSDPQITGAPNVIGGSSANVVGYLATGATIGGGGAANFHGTDVRNSVESIFATIGGGMSNSILGIADGATIGGGMRNTILWEGTHSTIGGGFLNLIDDDAGTATIAGGRENSVRRDGGSIGGGWGNTAVGYATVAGGQNNDAGGAFSTVGGGSANVALGSHATIGGGAGNDAGAPSEPNLDHAYATIGGGLFNRSAGDYSTIGGGYLNFGTNEGTTIAGGFVNTASNFYATVGGGVYNFVDGYGATIAGGGFNTVERGDASGSYAVIGGGVANVTRGDDATVAGGQGNVSAGLGATVGGGNLNFSSGRAATVVGGHGNSASNDFATVAGGVGNRAMGFASVVGGGGGGLAGQDEIPQEPNVALGSWSVVGGGAGNSSTGLSATIGGGRHNAAGSLATVGGGTANSAQGDSSTVGGGFSNEASGMAATVPGGKLNYATGAGSFAAGCAAQAQHTGAFVWSDGDAVFDVQVFASETNNEFAVRARGGVRFVSAISNGIPVSGVVLPPGGGSWSTLSDRSAKENVRPAGARDVLEKVAALPLATWNYKSQDKSIRHLGPMAQDFHDAFGLGENERTIATVDADGVALAAIQGLNEKVEEENRALRAELKSKERQIEELRRGLAELRQRMDGR